MAIYRDEGLVLRTVKLGEADRIVTILTRGHGKVRAVAKGVRRTKSRFGARLEPFMRDDLLISRGRNLDIVSQAVCIAAYADAICADYDLYANGGVMLETADKLVVGEHEPAPEQYRLLASALASLAGHRHGPRDIGASYLLRSLALAGWRPRLDSCIVCGRTDQLTHFSVPGGGVVCSRDRPTDAVAVDSATLARFRALSSGDWSKLDGKDSTPLCDSLVEKWGEYYLERPIRSLRLLDS